MVTFSRNYLSFWRFNPIIPGEEKPEGKWMGLDMKVRRAWFKEIAHKY